MGILLFLAKVYGDDIHIYSCSRISAFMDYSRVWVDLFSMDTVCVDNYSHERLEGFRIWDMESGTEYFILKRIEKGDPVALADLRLCLLSKLDKEKKEMAEVWASQEMGIMQKLKMSASFIAGMASIVISFGFNIPIVAYICALVAIMFIISARMSYRHHCMIISGLSLVKDLTEDELKGLLQEITTITDSEEE